MFDVTGILSQVKSGGLVNPISAGVYGALSTLPTHTLESLTALAQAQATANGVPVPNSTDLNNALSAINNAKIKVNDLLGHTDKLSGVNIGDGAMFTTIAKTMQSARSLSGEQSCASVLGAFGAIIKAAEMVSDTVDMAANVKRFFDDIPGQVGAIPTQMESYANKVAQQIGSDLATLAAAQIELAQQAVATALVSLIQDECASQVLAGVMAQPLKDELSKVASEVASKKLISITGK